MELRGIGQYTQSVAQNTRPQQAPAAADAAPQTQAAPAALPGVTRAPGGNVQARDLLTDEERGYLEMLFPGATAVDTYGGKGKSPAPPTGSIVDRKG